MNTLVLVDGEHYPPAVRAAVEALTESGHNVAAAVFLGGSEKLGSEDLSQAYGVPVVRGPEPRSALSEALTRYRPHYVIDLSDVPVVAPSDRFRIAALVLHANAVYRGADFELRPVAMAHVLTKPTVRVFATGKRVGKTAVAGALARHAVRRGFRPVIVAMGRGGPAHPVVLEVSDDISPAALLKLADAGRHAASDYIEDAVTSRVTTIGCRRVGGGLAGAPLVSNVVEGARIAEARDEDFVILEGSGAALPPVEAKAGLLCVPAHADPADVTGYLGPYRVLLADAALVTMADDPTGAARVEEALRSVDPGIEVVRAAFRPAPLADISGRRVFFCTTAPQHILPMMKSHLEDVHGCEVVGISHSLSDRPALKSALKAAPEWEVLLTELKAAAIDVAVREAGSAGREVVFCDNALVGGEVDAMFDRLLDKASSGKASGN